MQKLVIERDSAGKITSIAGAVTNQTNLRLLGGSLLFAGCGAVSAIIDLALPWQGQDFLASKADLMVLALGLFFFVIVALRFLPGGRAVVQYATKEGLAFRFFGKVGIVPWSQVRGFHQQSTDRLALAPEILIVETLGDQDWSISSANTKKPPPPGTLASSKTLDLDALQNALETMQSEYLGQTARTLSATPKGKAVGTEAGVIVGLVGCILLVAAAILHQHMVGQISFPSWLRWTTPDMCLLYGLVTFLLYRRFLGKPIR